MHTRYSHRLLCKLILLTTIGWSSNVSAELVSLTLEPGQFPNPSAVSVFVDARILGVDEVTSSISGELQLELLPSAVNPTSARILELSAQIDDAIDFQVGGGFLLPTVTVNVEPGELQLQLAEPGVAGQIERGQFDQFENLIVAQGLANTSIQADPFDLAEFDATPIDFENIELEISDGQIAVSTLLFTQVAIPVDLGILTLDISLEVDGEVKATGVIPPANYKWVGVDGAQYSDPEYWLRGDVADTGTIPASIDSLTIQGAVNLDGVREAANVAATASASLLNGTLSVSDSLMVPVDVDLIVAETGMLQTAGGSNLPLSGGGRLVVEGVVASDLAVTDGVLASGGGEVQSVEIAADGALELSTATTLRGSDIVFQPGSELHLFTPTIEAGEFRLADLDVVLDGLYRDADGLANEPSILVNNEQLFLATPADGRTAFASDDQFFGHTGGGIFGRISYSQEEGIVLTNEQAVLGDSDNDGVVGFQDFLRLSANFGQAGDWTSGDFDGDGEVQFADFLILSRGFGGPSPIAHASVPEPNNCTLLGPFFICLAVFRRRACR